MPQFNRDLGCSELQWQNDAYAREIADSAWDELQMMDWGMETEDEMERARRRSPIDQPCCLNPRNFEPIASLQRDPDTGYLEGTYYRCGNCGGPGSARKITLRWQSTLIGG
jgi:hypothetical protein